jgi:toxin ParE1/3/4
MRKIFWAKSAAKDLNELLAYIAADSEHSANLVGDRIDRAARNLADFATGHFGRVPDTYEVVVLKTPYILAYAKTETTITILRVIHGSRDWPEGTWPAD